MALVIEDGTGIPGATSYATVAELDAYAAARGITLPSQVADKEKLLIKAMDYVESFEPSFKGYRTWTQQATSWPRTDWRTDFGVPVNLKTAQIVYAIAAQNTDFFPVVSGTARQAVRQTVGPITVQYASASGANRPSVPQADRLLRTLFRNGGAGSVPVVRA